MLDRRTEERVRRIVDLSRRRDSILEAPQMDVAALANLTDDYETANMPSAAADLRKRLDYYRINESKKINLEGTRGVAIQTVGKISRSA